MPFATRSAGPSAARADPETPSSVPLRSSPAPLFGACFARELVATVAQKVTVAPLMPIPAHRVIYFRKEAHHQVTMQICGTLQDPNPTGKGREFEVELQYHRLDPFPSHRDRWEQAADDQHQEINNDRLLCSKSQPGAQGILP